VQPHCFRRPRNRIRNKSGIKYEHVSCDASLGDGTPLASTSEGQRPYPACMPTCGGSPDVVAARTVSTLLPRQQVPPPMTPIPSDCLLRSLYISLYCSRSPSLSHSLSISLYIPLSPSIVRSIFLQLPSCRHQGSVSAPTMKFDVYDSVLTVQLAVYPAPRCVRRPRPYTRCWVQLPRPIVTHWQCHVSRASINAAPISRRLALTGFLALDCMVSAFAYAMLGESCICLPHPHALCKGNPLIARTMQGSAANLRG
jgi:hypothetical protein